MNDFFTDLDTDIQGIKKTPHISQKPIQQIQKFSSPIKEKEIPIVKPTMKKPEHREPRERSKASAISSAPIITPHIAEVRAQMMEA